MLISFQYCIYNRHIFGLGLKEIPENILKLTSLKILYVLFLYININNFIN